MTGFEDAFQKLLLHEGGYVNDPDDPGGETKYGISKRVYPDVDIKSLTTDQARAIYRRDYWDKVSGDLIGSTRAAAVFDFAVNAGVCTAIRLAQTVSGTVADGVMGPKSVAAIAGMDEALFVAAFRLGRVARYTHLCEKNPKLKKYFFGWVRRSLS
jgi:lysozyme family protein